MRVEVYGDVLCPWCYIGKRRVTAALEQFAAGPQVRVVWRSYELGVDHLTPGPTAAEQLGSMWGAQAKGRLARIRELGQVEGLELNLHLARPVSTFDAHRLIQLGTARSRAEAVLEQLLHTYHTDALNIADPQILQQIGIDAGLDPAEVGHVVTSDAYSAAVRADQSRAAELGVSSVPSIIIDNRAPVSGIQAPTELRQLLQDAAERAVETTAETTLSNYESSSGADQP